MGFVLLAWILGVTMAVIGLVAFDIGWLAALGIWSLGGNAAAVLVLLLCHLLPRAPAPIPEPEAVDLPLAA